MLTATGTPTTSSQDADSARRSRPCLGHAPTRHAPTNPVALCQTREFPSTILYGIRESPQSRLRVPVDASLSPLRIFASDGFGSSTVLNASWVWAPLHPIP
ncbi:hypothetical protein H0G86_007529 [Trichoderma simmonsii]|uniref:Uncharacterized protein n=1 Tax=Trichoderma simmonsii TaxID=1491479 RepID=A0A8G0LDN9_9HYPO|nr:hypothetical protein H0G86_007529 [Trichoderma simmonsii]